MQNTFQNPILSGFYPDPSICRVGEDYYMVTSSFVYFPGLPIFHSRDLMHWEQIGHGISRPEQLDYKNCETSLGLWAPTIRYHEGTFYIINTFVSEGREARRDNYIITATDPAGPWSNACFIEGADGIDSSLFFDRDGRMWYAGNYISADTLYEGHHGIYLNELDPVIFQFKGPRTIIWDGSKSRSKWIEAPHIYYENGWYYLMVAEGGTFTNHSVMMARCRTIDGDYEICPRNPIVSHRHLSLHREISVVGHADLVQTQRGEWWMVLLGVRPYKKENTSVQNTVKCTESTRCESQDTESTGQHSFTENSKQFISQSGESRSLPENFVSDHPGDAHFNLGRETFLLPVVWDTDGWLRVDNENGLVNRTERRPDLPLFLPKPELSSDNFESPRLHPRWNTIHPAKTPFWSLNARPGCLRLSLLPEALREICTPAFLGRRQQHREFRMQAAIDFVPRTEYEEAGLALIQDDRFHYRFTIALEDGKRVVSVIARQKCKNVLTESNVLTGSHPADFAELLLGKETLPGAATDRVYLTVTATEEGYHFYYGMDDQSFVPVVLRADERLLSSIVNEGFTGTYLGMYASSNHRKSDNYVDYDWVVYEGR
ncbi:MAG: glycoside hydrolase family 43 protein [Clostridiales bacterium]|nr:glycoside hydrolase family 43 protein [Clostridiales bacterium]